MLVCSCLLASIGLDVNSTAVIIGAMLISPLMSPILGIGLAAGTADRKLLLESGRELGFATIVSLLTSAIYFRVSPLGAVTSELLARTTPTLLDVGVAFFGGVAGIIAGTRRLSSLALPGVAIAAALMPPICTAGFGFATGHYTYFFGALYLFTLNALFIALATFLVVRFLRFPLHEFASAADRRSDFTRIGLLAGIAILPSFWFLYTLVQQQRHKNLVNRFVANVISRRGHDVLRWDEQPDGDSTLLKVFVAGTPLDSAQLNDALIEFQKSGPPRTTLRVVQSDLTRQELLQMKTELQTDVLQALSRAESARDSVKRVGALQLSEPVNPHPGRDSAYVAGIANQFRRAFPEVTGIEWIQTATLLAERPSASRVLLRMSFARNTTSAGRRDALRRAQSFFGAQLLPDSVRVELR